MDYGQVEEACRKRVGTVLHDLHDLQNLLHVLPGCDQTLKHQHLVVDEHVAVWTSHHLRAHTLVRPGAITGANTHAHVTHVHKLRRQLEGGGFEAEVPGRAGQDEAEVDVDDVALGVQQDVPVVPAETAAASGRAGPVSAGRGGRGLTCP